MVQRQRILAMGSRATRRRIALSAGISVILMSGSAAAQLVPGGPAQVSPGGQAPVIAVTDRVTDISLGAPRTILNWSSFSLAADQTVVYRVQDRSWIVFNRISGPALIDGQIESLLGTQRGAGNVWFSAPGGVLFGPNARVNVGGLLATTAAVQVADFLDPSNLSFRFTGSGAGTLRVRAGAELKSGGGPLAFIASAVVTEPGASMTGNGTILYGAANDFVVRFAPQPGDLDLLDFIVPSGGGTGSATPLTLGGATVAGSVVLAVVNRSDIASAVINATGLIAAQSARADRGDIILSAGVDVLNRQPGAIRTNSVTETRATFGIVTAQRDLLGGFGAPTTLSAVQLASGRDLGILAATLDVGPVNAGRTLVLDAARGITLRGGASAGGAGTFRSNGAVIATEGPGSITTAGRLQLDVGSLDAGRLNAGRSVVVNAAAADGVGGVPALRVASALAEDDILFTASNASGSVFLGNAIITGARSDEAPIGRILSLTARGAQGDVTFGSTSGGSAISGATGVILSAGRDVTANVEGLLTLASGAAGRTFTVRATDLEITGSVRASNLRVESLGGALRLGSVAQSTVRLPAAGLEPALTISDAEFQRITVTGEASFYAGSIIGPARGDLTVFDLQVNTARVPSLLLAAGNASDILVTGVLAPDPNGGVLTIGESDSRSVWRPGRILVTGAIGFATGSPAAGFDNLRPFDIVNLNAVRDIILGSSRFVALVAATPPRDIDVSANRPSGVAPTSDEQDRVLLTTAALTLSASDRIVQQNTGSRAQPNGILITSLLRGASALAVTPAKIVDLYSAFRSGTRGGFQPIIRDGGAASAIIRFNGCFVAEGGCAVASSSRKTLQLADFDLIDPKYADGLFSLPPSPPILVIAEPDPDAIVTDAVSLGSGSDEIWRNRRNPK